MNTDPIADLLTRIRNAVKAKHAETRVPYSKMKVAILDVLKSQQFIKNYKVVKDGSKADIEIQLDEELKEMSLKRISKPGQRIYIKKDQIRKVLNGYGIGVISTPKGVMTTAEARKTGLGGEYLCEIW